MQLRDYQERTKKEIYNYFLSHPNPENPLAVLPTGAGKSVVIADFCKEILHTWGNQRILILTHVKELIQQNYHKMVAVWPEVPAGVYCASLNARRAHDPITLASIQSVYQKAHILGWRDLIIIDECHLLSNNSESMYRRLLNDLRAINPRLKVIGFTATPYRMKSGLLHKGEGRLFTDIAVEIEIGELLAGGWLCRLISKSSLVQADLSHVRTVGGEFNAKDSEEAMDKEELTNAALDEVEKLASNRKSWLIFCSGIHHAEHVCSALKSRGISAAAIHSEKAATEREGHIENFKAGKIRALTNANVLTTGFDAPNTDLLVLLRPTQSPGLYTQILGRGMRIAPGKENCLVLDFAGNVKRFGPVMHIIPPAVRKASGKKKDVHIKSCLICPNCRTAAPLYAMECTECGRAFEPPERINHAAQAADLDVMGDVTPPTEKQYAPVSKVEYHLHKKPGSPNSIRVDYHCGLNIFSEWICFGHQGVARWRAEDWWRRRASWEEIPTTAERALEIIKILAADYHGREKHDSPILEPEQIEVVKEGKYWRVNGYVFENATTRYTPVAASS